MKTLIPGDRVRFLENGRKLRGTVLDYLPMKENGELLIPVERWRSAECKIDKQARGKKSAPFEKRVRWLPRRALRKLPSR